MIILKMELPDPDLDWLQKRKDEDRSTIKELINLPPLELIKHHQVHYNWVMSFKDKFNIPYITKGLPVITSPKQLPSPKPSVKKQKCSDNGILI